MILIIFKIKYKGDFIFIPLVIFRNCSKELILRYCTNGIDFFPNALETNKLNAFISTDLLHKFIERYDFEINETSFIEVDVDHIEVWTSNQEKQIEVYNILNFHWIIHNFYFFMNSNLIDFDKLKLLQKICEYKQEKEVYDEFIDNCNAGLYSSKELESIEHNCPDRTEYDLSLQDPCLKNELKYLIGLFKTILYIHPKEEWLD